VHNTLMSCCFGVIDANNGVNEMNIHVQLKQVCFRLYYTFKSCFIWTCTICF